MTRYHVILSSYDIDTESKKRISTKKQTNNNKKQKQKKNKKKKGAPSQTLRVHTNLSKNAL